MTLKRVLNVVAFTILLFGALCWAFIGIFNFNLISTIFMGYRSWGSITMHVLIGLSAVWLLISSIVSSGRIQFVEGRERDRRY